MAYGFKGHCGIARETTWGTPVAATSYFKALSESLVQGFDRFPVANIYGGFYEHDDETGLRRFQGDVVVPAHAATLGHFCRGALGVNSVSVVLSGVLFHNDFYPATTDATSINALPPYTLEVFRDITSADQFAGVQFNTLVFAISPNQPLQVTANVIARQWAGLAATTPTFSTSPTGMFQYDTCSCSIGGVGVDKVESFTFRFDNKLEGIPTLVGSNMIGRIQRTGPAETRISGVLTLTDYTDINAFVNQTEQRFTFNFTKGNSFSFLIDLPRVVYSTFPHQNTGRDRLTVSFEGIARYHVGSATACRLRLTTTTSF